MFKTPGTSKNHCDTIFVTSMNYFLVSDRSTGLNHNPYPGVFNGVYAISKWEKRIGCQNATSYTVSSFS